MNRHLSQRKLDQLSQNFLDGAEYFDALAHIESCVECRAKMKPVRKQEVLRVFEETSPAIQSNEPTFQAGWRWWFAFSAAAAALIIGLVWFNWRETKLVEIVKGPEKLESPTLLNNTNSETPVPDRTPDVQRSPEPMPAMGGDEKGSKGDPGGKQAKLGPFPEKSGNSNEVKKSERRLDFENSAVPRAQEEVSPDIAGLKRFLVRIPAALIGLRPLRGAVRDGSAVNSRFLAPNGEVVREISPQLRWSSENGADKYKVSLNTKQYQEVALETTKDTEFRPSRPLERGKSYIWKVKSLDSEGKPANPAKKDTSAIFKVASEKVVARLEKLERSGAGDWKVAEFMLNEGMLGEAEARLQALHRKYPKNKLARKLLLRVKKLRSSAR